MDSGEPIIEMPGQEVTGQLVQFSRENSNVDIIKEMMEMIMTQKGLELLSKAMQAGEAMLKLEWVCLDQYLFSFYFNISNCWLF